MELPPLPKNSWTLTQGAFDLLLLQFDSDRQEAGKKYELLRRKLVKFFQWRGCTSAEDLADETINRVARNLETGETVLHLAAYCVGIARNVFLENLRTRRREETLPVIAYPSPAPDGEDPRRECLEHCLKELSPGNLRLIVQYYQQNELSRIKARRNLAEQLAIPPNALRIRAHRIRARLQVCVEECVRRQQGEGNESAASSLESEELE